MILNHLVGGLMNKILIALVLVVGLSDLSWGKWIEIDKNEIIEVFYDESNISIIDQDKLSVNILLNHLNSEDYKSSIIVNVFNCKKRFYKIQTAHVYSDSMGKGSREFYKNISSVYNLDDITLWIDSSEYNNPNFLNFFNKICKTYLPKVKINTNITANEYLSHLSGTNEYKFNCEIIPRNMDPEYKYLSKQIKKKYDNSVDALNEGNYKKAIVLSEELLGNPNLKDFDKAMIFRMISFIYSNQGDQKRSIEYLTKSLCLNSLNINDQFIQHQNLIDFYYSNNQIKSILPELLKIRTYFTNIYSIEKKPSGFLAPTPLPKNNWLIEIDSMLAEFYIFSAKNTPKESLAEKEFYKKARQHINNALSNSFSPMYQWYEMYLDILIYEKNYNDAFKILKKMFDYAYFYPENDDYKKNLSNKYSKLKNIDVDKFNKILDKDLDSFIHLTLESEPFFANSRAQTDGWSLVQFDINKDGEVENSVVINSSGTAFHKPTIKSINKTKYKTENTSLNFPLKNQKAVFYFKIMECPWPSYEKPPYTIDIWRSCAYKPLTISE